MMGVMRHSVFTTVVAIARVLAGMSALFLNGELLEMILYITLLGAAAKVLAESTDVIFLIVGDGELRD